MEDGRKNYLFNLIEQGDNVKIKEFFKQHPELINKINSEHDWTPIMYACRYGNYDLLQLLLDIGFLIDRSHTTPSNLVHLCFYSHTMQIVRYLMTKLVLESKEIT